MKHPKILFYDIETSPNLAYVWGKFEQDVLAYHQEFEILSVAFKWQGGQTLIASRNIMPNEKNILGLMRTMFNAADVIVAQNGDRFDYKKLAARMLYHGIKPPKTPISIDTLKVARKYFAFNGNSLNDLGTFLKLGKKAKHPGFEMWLGCMKGDKKSWARMERYNKQDVLLLERIYKRMLPWIESPKKAVDIVKGRKKT